MSSLTKTLQIAWVKQGTKQWEEWWTSRHGETLPRVPSLQDHIGFANYDLTSSGLPKIAIGVRYLELRGVSESRVAVAQQILERHGFQVVGIS